MTSVNTALLITDEHDSLFACNQDKIIGVYAKKLELVSEENLRAATKTIGIICQIHSPSLLEKAETSSSATKSFGSWIK